MRCEQAITGEVAAITRGQARGPEERVAGRADEAKLKAAGQAFEGFLLGEMIKIMQETVRSEQGLLPPNRAEQMFRRQQAEALGEALAAREPLEIARLSGLHQPGEGR